MTTNIIVGVGGTGAKIVEAVLHLAAAGLGPETLKVGFVDQDQANGNVSRSRQLLRTLVETRALWRDLARPHRIDASQSDLLYTDIRPIAANGAECWIPHQGQHRHLTSILGELGDDRYLFDILFARGDAEQTMILDEGYRGRPHIGSAVITASVDQDAEFWKSLVQLISQAQGGDDIRLLLAGSVFGGTGAAGFPTLARLIRKRLETAGINRNVAIAGVLMLPYFGFAPADASNGHAANVARAEDLLIQSRGALRYYDALFRQEQVFDELYLAGWNRPFNMGYHAPGSGKQVNPALVPELIAAIGACRFFNPEHEIDDEGANAVFVCSRLNDKTLSWTDLPGLDSIPGRDDAYRKLGKLLRFGMAWKYWGTIVGKPQNMFASALNSHPWSRAQSIPNGKYYTNHSPTDELTKLSEYLDAMFLWAGSMQAYATKDNALTFDLWRVNDIMEGPPRFETPWDLLTVKPALNGHEWAASFDKVIVKKPGAGDLPSPQFLTSRLNEEPFPGDHHAGLGRIVAAVHAYSDVALPSHATR